MKDAVIYFHVHLFNSIFRKIRLARSSVRPVPSGCTFDRTIMIMILRDSRRMRVATNKWVFAVTVMPINAL